MRKFLCFICALCLFILPAFAEGETVADPVQDPVVITPDVNVYIQEPSDSLTYVGTSVYALNPVTPENTTGLKSVLLSLIGDYDSVVVETQYENSNGDTVVEHDVQLDFPWLCSVGIFAIVLFCVLRAGGAILCSR